MYVIDFTSSNILQIYSSLFFCICYNEALDNTSATKLSLPETCVVGILYLSPSETFITGFIKIVTRNLCSVFTIIWFPNTNWSRLTKPLVIHCQFEHSCAYWFCDNSVYETSYPCLWRTASPQSITSRITF